MADRKNYKLATAKHGKRVAVPVKELVYDIVKVLLINPLPEALYIKES